MFIKATTSFPSRKFGRSAIIFDRFSALILSFGLALALSASAFADDPLFSQMQGHWIGHGSRFHPISGRQIVVDTEVTTSFEVIRGKTALLSQNRITETAAGAPPKTYLSDYWIRQSDNQPDPKTVSYELGVQGSTLVASTGVLGADGVFRVEQDFGNANQAEVDRSETHFLLDQTNYSDVFSLGAEIQTQTQIEYHRQ
jgi:hypothetical protein